MIERMRQSRSDGLLQALARHAHRRLRGGGRAADRRLVLASQAAAAARRGDPDRPAVPRPLPLGRRGDQAARDRPFHQFMSTDSAAVLKHGVELGVKTWQAFLRKLGWVREQVDKVICHQVGAGAPRHDPQVAGHRRREGVLDVPVPGQHRHRLAAADRRPGRGPRLPPARRPGRVPRHRQRAELPDAGAGVVSRMTNRAQRQPRTRRIPGGPPGPRLRPRRPALPLPRRGRRRARRHGPRQPDAGRSTTATWSRRSAPRYRDDRPRPHRLRAVRQAGRRAVRLHAGQPGRRPGGACSTTWASTAT